MASSSSQRILKATRIVAASLAACALVTTVHAIPNILPPPHIQASLPDGWRRGIVPSGFILNSTYPSQLESRAKAHKAKGPTILEACLITAGIETTTSALNGTETFWDAAQSDNLHFHYHPHAVVFPTSTDQVSKALQCVADKDPSVAVAARSGGHSFGGYSSGGQDGSLIIDLKYLDYARLRSDGSQLAEVGPATRLGDVVKALWNNGHKRGMPHGTCPVVGVGGHALCGGFGPTSRKWGMSTDALVEAEVVLANGTVVKASRNENPELLWGLKGAGSNFGIATQLVFETQPVDTPTMFIEYRWSPSIASGADAARIFKAVQSYATDGSAFPEEFGFHLQFQPHSAVDPEGGHLSMHMRGVFLGNNATYQAGPAMKLWDHFKKAHAPLPDGREEKELSYYALMEEWDDFGNAGHKLDTQAERLNRNNFIARTELAMGQKGFSESSMATILQYLYDLTLDLPMHDDVYAWNVYMEMFGGGKSARHRAPDVVKSTSFPHRDALWLIQASMSSWGRRDLSPAAFKQMNKFEDLFVRAMKDDGIERRSFPCYVDAHKDRAEAQDLFYGDKVLPRLEALKKDVDPHNVFRNPQSIGKEGYAGPQLGAAPVTDSFGAKLDGVRVSHPLPRYQRYA
ncbi:unnamed protein product [Parajaminaea phylloscopi]